MKIAQAFEAATRSLEYWLKQAVERGPLSLLERKPQDRSKFRKLDGVAEAKLVRPACSPPPEGHACWSLRLLADALVVVGGSRFDRPRVRASGASKSELKPWRRKMWCIPPMQNAAFVAQIL